MKVLILVLSIEFQEEVLASEMTERRQTDESFRFGVVYCFCETAVRSRKIELLSTAKNAARWKWVSIRH